MSKKLPGIRLLPIELEIGRKAPSEGAKPLQQFRAAGLARDGEFPRIGDMDIDLIPFLEPQRFDHCSGKAEGEAIDTLSFGFFLFRVAPGATVSFEQTSVNGEVWLPSRISVRAEARIAVLKKMHAEIDITYREYRKFQADSKIIADGLEPKTKDGLEPKTKRD